MEEPEGNVKVCCCNYSTKKKLHVFYSERIKIGIAAEEAHDSEVTHRAKMSGLFHELKDDRGDLLAKSRWSIETPSVASVSRSCCTLDGQLITASTPAATSFCVEASLPLAMSHLHNQNTNHHQNSFNQYYICQHSKCTSLTPNSDTEAG